MSIHDISRVDLDSTSKLPRFNMPLELGADLGLRIKGPSKQRDRRLLILEKEQHRYDITASDLSGQDVEAHGDSQPGIISCVRNWLNARHDSDRPLPGAEAIQADYESYLKIAPVLIAAEKLDPYERLSHPDFLWTIYAALEEIERRRSKHSLPAGLPV